MVLLENPMRMECQTLNLTSFNLYLMIREIIIELCVYMLTIRLLTD